MGIDIWEVIEAAQTKPFGFMPFYPGLGLSGHCTIAGFNAVVIATARAAENYSGTRPLDRMYRGHSERDGRRSSHSRKGLESVARAAPLF